MDGLDGQVCTNLVLSAKFLAIKWQVENTIELLPINGRLKISGQKFHSIVAHFINKKGPTTPNIIQIVRPRHYVLN